MSDNTIFTGFVKRTRTTDREGEWGEWYYEQGNSSGVNPMIYTKTRTVPMRGEKEGIHDCIGRRWTGSYPNEVYHQYDGKREIQILRVNVEVDYEEMP